MSDDALSDLLTLIRDSFRVRVNHEPAYVDVAGHLARVRSSQHQIIFGRRGSGKSCLLVHFHRNAETLYGAHSIYLDADEIKQLRYPDLLIRLLLSVFRHLPGAERRLVQRLLRRPATPLQRSIAELQELLDRADTERVIESREASSEARSGVSARIPGFAVSLDETASRGQRRTSEFEASKIDVLERHLQDYKQVVGSALGEHGIPMGALIVDDSYLLRRSEQPDVIDYLHRLLRGTNLYLKIGTIRHRTTLKRFGDQFIGVELTQDIESLDLDRTLEDLPKTQAYLSGILDRLGERVGLPTVTGTYVSIDGAFALTLASGGVPRDYLSIFVEAVEEARERGATRWITPTHVYKGAARVSYQQKLQGLRSDVGSEVTELEALFQDLYTFCIHERKKTAFLSSQDEVGDHEREHELIQQLTDFKLIHVVEPDTSAASGRPGRYEAYTLDAASYMEPRRRGIEIVEFWKTDDQRRKVGLREAPVYSLARAAQVKALPEALEADAFVETATESSGDAEAG